LGACGRSGQHARQGDPEKRLCEPGGDVAPGRASQVLDLSERRFSFLARDRAGRIGDKVREPQQRQHHGRSGKHRSDQGPTRQLSRRRREPYDKGGKKSRSNAEAAPPQV